MIYFTSDWHFNHDRDFIYEPRGYESMEEMCEDIIKKHNSIVKGNDQVYVLGDLMLGKGDYGIQCISRLKGNIHVIMGNHDTDMKISAYLKCKNISDVKLTDRIKIGKKIFYLSHYPMMMGNFDEKKWPWCLHGHTHSKEKFQYGENLCYNVSIDAHDSYPVSMEEILEDIRTYNSINH